MIIQSATRRNFLAGLGVSALVAASSATPARAQNPADSSLAARWNQLRLIDSDDNSFYLGNARKPLTLIGMWASWCAVCQSEYAQLAALQDAVGPQSMHVIMVSHPNWWDDDRKVAKSRGMKFTLATADPSNSPESINDTLTNNGDYFVPRTLVFRREADELDVVMAQSGRLDLADGKIAARLRGAMV